VKEVAAKLDFVSPVGKESTRLVAVLAVVLRGTCSSTRCGSIYQLNISVGTVEVQYNEEDSVKISIKIRPEDTTEVIHDLMDQQMHLGADTLDGPIFQFRGDKFNFYVHPIKTAIIGNTRRLIEILPKDTPL